MKETNVITKRALFGLTLNELIRLAKDEKMPGYAAKQIAEWLYTKEISSIDEMTNLSIRAREQLKEKYVLGLSAPTRVSESTDGTKKYLFATGGSSFVETAYIPDADRRTLCVSSQVGCRMGCLFCMTGKQGFQANLTSGEIVNQLRSIPEWKTITNIVFMGMGEPFDNLDPVLKSLEILTSEWGMAMSPKRITVSSIGIVPAMRQFLSQSQCHLAISLHSPFDEERRTLMPIQNAHPIGEVVKELRNFDFSGQRRISFEYILFDGINDSPRHVKELVRLLKGLPCRINLIRFHRIPGTNLKGASEAKLIEFRNALTAKGLFSTIRASRGADIHAACGLLSTDEKKKMG